MRLVVIGGDAAGMSAASRARRNAPDMEVVVLEMTRDVSYSACGMPYALGDTNREMDDLVVRRAEVFRDKQGIDLRTGHRVDAIDVQEKKVRGVTLEGGAFEVGYDKLLVATGASAVMPDLPGADLPGVVALKSLEDGRAIRGLLDSGDARRAVVLGMGYIALEMAEAFCRRGVEVVMVKPGPVFLPWLHPELAGEVQREVTANGVSLRAGEKITRIEKGKDGGLKVLTDAGAMDCDMVLAAMGVTPNSRMAKAAGLSLGPGGAVSVDKNLLTSCPDIYAAGDCADAFHVVTGEKVWIPLALRANRAGWAVADNVTGKSVALPGIAGTAVFKVFDLQVARTGLNVAEAGKAGFDPVEIVIQSRSRAHAHPGNTPIRMQMVGDRRSRRLLGVQMVGKEGVAHRINAPAVALHAGMTVADFFQCDLAYAPPFSPVWDPMLTAAQQLLKAMGR